VRPLIALLGLAAALWAQPRRIVSTAPSITETLFALGLGDRVVGVSQYCHYPPETATRTRVGSYLRPHVETVVSLRPDLVITQSTTNSVAPQLTRMNIPVLEVEHGDLERTFAAIQSIGDRCGVGDRGSKLVSDIRERLGAIRQRTSNLPRRSLVFVVGRSPGALERLTAVGKDSYLNELIDIAGGVNALASASIPYPRISLETVLGLNPDVLVDMGDMADTVAVTEGHRREVVALWSKYAALKAASERRVFAVASDIFVVPGPRVVDAAEAFEKMLHPEVPR